MISVDEARAIVRDRARLLTDTETVPLADAVGRVLAEPVRADRDDPPFDRAMMDGYALRAVDTEGAPRNLDVVGRIAAGDTDLPEIAPGTAAWINTGAPVPPGADAVLQVEKTRGEVEVLETVPPGRSIMPRGSLARAGDAVADGVLTPARVAVCASAGLDPVRVLRRPRVAILATGTELRKAPGAHEIRNSNGPMLRALLGGFCEIIDLGVADDDPTDLDRRIARGLACDALLTTGGVSKGDLDLVRPGIEARGVEVLVHGVALQPGKPFLFGRHEDGVVFGLPGNPVSALVCADLFALPYLGAVAGRGEELREVTGRMTGPVAASPKRRRVFPCRLNAGSIEPLPWRSSADLYTAALGNAYMVVEPGHDLAAGDETVCLVPARYGPA